MDNFSRVDKIEDNMKYLFDMIKSVDKGLLRFQSDIDKLFENKTRWAKSSERK